MKRPLIVKLLLYNQRKVRKSSVTKGINIFEKNPIKTENNQRKVYLWKVNRALT